MKDVDVIVVGSGVVGAVTALLLAQHTSLNILVLEAHLPTAQPHRVSAISLASKKIFESLGVWDAICSKGISPFQKMFVWDAKTRGEIHFDCREVNERYLGFIIQDQVMRQCLSEKFFKYKNLKLISPIELISYQEKERGITLQDRDHNGYHTQLLIAADGAKSWVRTQAGIPLKEHAYEQSAIVATVTTEFPHQQTAWQRFLPTGPLAFLPLQDEHQCSIVWSSINAQQLMQYDDENFCEELSKAFDHKLGKIKSIEKRYIFPLKMTHAEHYVLPHLALVGDAAHTIHPLAGQGVNMGLQDALCLSNCIQEPLKKRHVFFDKSVLRKYERTRKSKNLELLTVVDCLHNVFGSHSASIHTLRNFGLNATDRMNWLKKFFMQYASGVG